MTSKGPEEENVPSDEFDEDATPRKRLRLDNSSRKSWSLMDKRTDQEVLQEMGVSLLEPDEAEFETTVQHHKPPKRKRDIENVNPNVNLMSPRSRGGSRSPKAKCSPSPGPSKLRSPRSIEKCKPLQPTENLESLLNAEYQIDEETPLGQSVSADYRAHRAESSSRRDHTIQEELPPSPRLEGSCMGAGNGEDAFAALSDEVVLGVLRWLPKRALAHCMVVCKRWYRVACDETLWQRLDLGNKIISKGALGRILSRKPLILRLANSEVGEWHPTSAPSPSRVQYLDLSMAAIDTRTLECLLERCPLLKKLSLEGVAVRDETCELIGKCGNLETLNLTMCQGITAEGVTYIVKGCSNLQALNISWCNLSAPALRALVSLLPQRLRRLNVAGAKLLTDDMVTQLTARVPALLELDVSDCARLGVGALAAAMSLSRLEHLALSRCYLLPPARLTKLSSMPSLQYLEVWGMLQAGSLAALRAALPAIQLNHFMFSAIARPTVGSRRTSIWGLRTRD